MLVDLIITNIVLIESLELHFQKGLITLTGETGAGKSILLDSLNLALGRRAEARLIRKGAEFAEVVAIFKLSPDQPVSKEITNLLDEAGIELGLPTDQAFEIILRRMLYNDGRSRGYLNDRPISITLLRQIGELLIEIQGQDDRHGLMDSATHLDLLDDFGSIKPVATLCARSYHNWRKANKERLEHEAAIASLEREQEFLIHAISELQEFAPRGGESEELSEQHSFLKNASRLADAIASASQILAGNDGAEVKIAKGLRSLERLTGQAVGRLDVIIQGLERALSEIADANGYLNDLAEEMADHANQLERLETRLFRLKDLARKYSVTPEAIPQTLENFQQQLQGLEIGQKQLKNLIEKEKQARQAFIEQAAILSNRRKEAALNLEKAVNRELPALKLQDARFMVAISLIPEEAMHETGGEKISFQISTNPSSNAGPLQKIASGGELSRFLLALKVALAGMGSAPTLIFDEVDSGLGGATAAAVGERLARLADHAQLMVITHSPQVAARGSSHLKVWKRRQEGNSGAELITEVYPLDQPAREQEIARMLSGEQISEEAMAAARRLLHEAKA